MSPEKIKTELVQPSLFDIEAFAEYLVPDTPEEGVLAEHYILWFPAGSEDEPRELNPLVAEWLHYLTYADDMGSLNEGDKFRFYEPAEIVTKFLNDRGGRNLFVAINKATLMPDAVFWEHRLQDDIRDKKLREDRLKVPQLAEVELASVSTAALREYESGLANNTGMYLRALATSTIFERKEDCKGIIGRFSSSDPEAQLLLDHVDLLPGEHPYRIVSSRTGFVVMAALRDLESTEYTGVQEEHPDLALRRTMQNGGGKIGYLD